MTTVAVKIYDNEIHLVADTRLTKDWHQKDDIKLEKIIKHNDIYAAGCGEASTINFFDIFIRTNTPAGDSIVDITTFAHKFFLYVKEMTGRQSFESILILVFKGKVFLIFLESLSVFEVDNHYAMGSGGKFADAALHLGKTPEEAVELACKLDAFSELPLQKFIISKK